MLLRYQVADIALANVLIERRRNLYRVFAGLEYTVDADVLPGH